MVPTESLKPAPYNPRKISDDALQRLRRGIREFGIVDPIVVRRKGKVVIGGHQRLRAAIEEGIKEVPVIFLAGLSEAKAKALNVLLNNPNAQGEWDVDDLHELLRELDDDDFDATLTGFDENDLEEMLAQDAPQEERAPDLTPPEKPKSKRGEIYELGPHRLMCGDATSEEDAESIVGTKCVHLVITSPPYNVGIDYSDHQDTMPRDDYLGLIRSAVNVWRERLCNGCFFAWNIGVRPKTYPYQQAVILENAGLVFYRQIVWEKVGVPYPVWSFTTKTKSARKYYPNWTHEMIYLFHKGEEPTAGGKIVPDDEFSRDVINVPQHLATKDLKTVGQASDTLIKRGKPSHRVKEHPAAFPVRLAAGYINHLTADDEVVCDPFAGSGATIIAAEQLGRTCYAMEIDPAYCDVARRRYAEYVNRPELAP